MDGSQHPLVQLVNGWLGKLTLAQKYKLEKFTRNAETCMRFFHGGAMLSKWLWDEEARGGEGFTQDPSYGYGQDARMSPPMFRMTLNKVAELVQLFGPSIYHTNPVRTVTATRFSDLDQQTLQLAIVGPPPQAPPPPQPPPAPPQPAPPQLAPDTPPNQAAQVQQQYQQFVASQQQQYQAQVQAQQQQYQQFIQQQQQAYQQAIDTQLKPLLEQEQQRVMLNECRARLLSDYLNYTPNINDLKDNCRKAIDETLIKGASCLWAQIVQPHQDSHQVVGTFYDTIDNLLLDPDAEVRSDCQWIAQRCVHPIWDVEREFGFEEGELRKYRSAQQLESVDAQGASSADAYEGLNRKTGKTNDLIVYWKIWSKMGMGDRMTGMQEKAPDLVGTMREFGDYVYLVVAQGIPFPLNLPDSLMTAAPQPDDNTPPEVTEQQVQAWKDEMFQRVQWPVPFYADDAWPVTIVSFHDVPNCVWPMSHLTPALGELKFLNFAFSFLASKVRTSCGTFVAIMKGAGEELKQQIIEGGDNTVLMLESALGQRISDVVSFLEQPPFHGDIYHVINAVIDIFEKRTGLTEILYGQTSTQSRTAMDVNVKQQNASIRVDDMANRFEDQASELARKEAMAARWLLSYDDVLPILGPLRARLWQQLVQTADFETVVHELDYRIEAGSARKPNKSTRIDQMNNAMQVLVPIFDMYFQRGNAEPLQWLVGHWADAMDIDASGLDLSLPPPPQGPPPGPPQGGAPSPPQGPMPPGGQPKGRATPRRPRAVQPGPRGAQQMISSR